MLLTLLTCIYDMHTLHDMTAFYDVLFISYYITLCVMLFDVMLCFVVISLSLCLYMTYTYICVYMCVYTYIYIYMYIYTHVCIVYMTHP